MTLSPKQLLERQKQRNACLAFFEVIIFMVGFLILMWTHEDIGRVYELERVVKNTLKKPFGPHSKYFYDIQDVGGIWDWLDLSLYPSLVKHVDEVSL